MLTVVSHIMGHNPIQLLINNVMKHVHFAFECVSICYIGHIILIPTLEHLLYLPHHNFCVCEGVGESSPMDLLGAT